VKIWYDGLSKGKKMLLLLGVLVVVSFLGDQLGFWTMSLPGPTEPVN
jgi:hypothetical protein